jgi:hypothetical protein
VFLVLDGLGWHQLCARRRIAPALAEMTGRPVHSVAPTTTATALTSISTGLPPAVHGVIGYRVRVGDDEVLNVLRWRTRSGDANHRIVPAEFQPYPAFAGLPIPVVTRAEFAQTGFTIAHLRGGRLHGWRMASSVAVEVGALLRAGEPLVYAYYDGMDKIAHEHGFGAHYDAELRATDTLVAGLLDVLPPGAALVITSDHGQVDVGDAVVEVDASLNGDIAGMSGEGRFRWLHARPGTTDRLRAAAQAAHGEVAWVRSVEEMEASGWFGGPLSAPARARLGDVALVAHADVAFGDPDDTGELRLRCRHGSLTPAEVEVPLLCAVR